MKFKTEQEILLSMINKAQEHYLISADDDLVERVANEEQTENQYVLDLATHAYILHDFTMLMEEMYNGVDISTAMGDQLDRLGHLVNVPRLPGLPASVTLQLSLSLPQTTDITIPSGTVVLIDQLQVDPYITYTTDSTITIHAGTTTASVTCSSDLHALQRRIPAESVQGLEGFPTVNVTNLEESTSGRNIEEDSDYRQRILLWNVKNQVGTKASFDAYLGTVEGLDDYKLIKQPEGVGTLTIVCDCEEGRLPEINEGIQENCMIFSDDPVQTIKPDDLNLDVELECMITREPIQHTVSEIIELIIKETETFVNGGNMRTGGSIHGMHIGEDFMSSQLVMHLHSMFPELLSIEVTNYTITDELGDPAVVTDYKKLQSRTTEVEIT